MQLQTVRFDDKCNSTIGGADVFSNRRFIHQPQTKVELFGRIFISLTSWITNNMKLQTDNSF